MIEVLYTSRPERDELNMFIKIWLREKGSNLHLRVQSPTCCRLHHPATHCRFAIANCRLNLASAENQLAINNWQSTMTLVAVEGIEPTSLDYRSSALAVELHRESGTDFSL